jgi:transcriptional regulator with XRE-family HTH domain
MVFSETQDPLVAIGKHIRAKRKQLKVTAITVAQTAGISRVTLHRIERGEATVSVGSYIEVLWALGLRATIENAFISPAERDAASALSLPARVVLAQYPQLKALAWHIPNAKEVSLLEAHSLYTRNKRFIDQKQLQTYERQLIENLRKAFD